MPQWTCMILGKLICLFVSMSSCFCSSTHNDWSHSNCEAAAECARVGKTPLMSKGNFIDLRHRLAAKAQWTCMVKSLSAKPIPALLLGLGANLSEERSGLGSESLQFYETASASVMPESVMTHNQAATLPKLDWIMCHAVLGLP